MHQNIKDKPCINCRWLETRTIVVNPDGQVLPCCYFANSLYMNLQTDGTEAPRWNDTEVLINYKNNIQEYNLNNKTITEILESDWFNIDLPKSWESYETLPSVCGTFCNDIQKENEA